MSRRRRQQKKPQIVLSGYYGFDNTGDEAVLDAICHILRQQIPEVPLVALSNNVDKTRADHGIAAVDRWRLQEVKTAISQCGLFISGGGSLFQDVTSFKGLLYYVMQIFLARFYRKPVMIYAQGLGPLNRFFSRFMVKLALNRAHVITWRDEDSKNLAREIGVTKPMTVCCDPVLAWQPQAKNLPELPEGKKIIFSLRPWDGISHDLAALALLGDTMVKQGYQVIFLPFHGEHDAKIHQQVRALMTEPAFELPPLAPEQAMAVLGRMELVIAMRLHALIMAAAQGIPVASISYDPKVDAFARSAGQMVVGRAGHLTPHSLVGAVSEVLANQEKERLRLEALKPNWLEKAQTCGSLAKELYISFAEGA